MAVHTYIYIKQAQFYVVIVTLSFYLSNALIFLLLVMGMQVVRKLRFPISLNKKGDHTYYGYDIL